MKNLSPKQVATLVQKAFCLEAIADKPDCTSRFVDLEGKPLEDFILAGINCGPVFEAFAKDWLGGKRSIYSWYTEALKASQIHKSGKFVNFGLLEIMFPTVAARLTCNDPGKIVQAIIETMSGGSTDDVKHMIAARQLGWKSSVKRRLKLSELTPTIKKAENPMDFYNRIAKTPTLGSSAYQWSKHYQDGLPFLAAQFEYLQKTKGPLLPRISAAFAPVHKANPKIKIGILADMCAAAIFLHLSFLD